MYFLRMQGRVTGPFDMVKLKSLRARGVLQPFHEVSADRSNWTPASSLTEIFASVSAVPVAAPVAQDPDPALSGLPASQPWFYLDMRKEQIGPIAAEDFPSLVLQGAVNKRTLVWSPGMPEWLEAQAGLPYLFHAATGTDEASSGRPIIREKKNRVVAILLAWFLGLLGIHQFYLGNTGKGATYLVLSILVIPIPVIAILCLIDIITIATSKDTMFE